MKPLKESFIKAKDLDKMGKKWPNPYGLTEKDAKGKIKGIPLEIITLILKEMELQGKSYNALLKIQTMGISSITIFDWYLTKDGPNFWSDIWYENEYNIFYKKYTPQKLKERLKEE